MADTQSYYDSTLTGEELDAAFRRIPQIDASVQAAGNSAVLAQSWAQGGTGAREGEDSNNARYWAQQAQLIAGGALGWFADEEELEAACPEGQSGWWAIVGTTDTVWTWDADTGAWVDTVQPTDLSDYYTRAQVRALVPFLYKATFLLDAWTGNGPCTQTAALVPVDGGPAVMASSLLLPTVGMDNTLPADSKKAMRGPAQRISAAAKTLGAGTMTVTLDTAPDVDVELYFTIKQGGN